ncbi:MAG: dimethylarginine dimethylaminohydrolase family protein [Xanthobacteraceae bacterium]
MTPLKPAARFLMCRPEHFAVSYTINPWMDPPAWARDGSLHSAAAHREWNTLYRTLLEHGAAVDLVPPAAGVPDLVFTANAAVVLDRKVLLARFRHPERQAEEPHFEDAFNRLKARGLVDTVRRLPDGVVLEGAGDCVFDHGRNMFWLGYGQRSDAAAQRAVEEVFGVEVTPLELADPRFYHMDTALSPLPRGEVMYVPEAFTAAGLATIRARVPRSKRIEVGTADAEKLAANAVCLGDTLIMAGCGERLRGALEERGYHVATTPLRSFLKSGGAAFCLTLRLDRRSRPGTAIAQAAVA